LVAFPGRCPGLSYHAPLGLGHALAVQAGIIAMAASEMAGFGEPDGQVPRAPVNRRKPLDSRHMAKIARIGALYARAGRMGFRVSGLGLSRGGEVPARRESVWVAMFDV